MDAEKENTFRALKDEPLIVTSFLCRFNLHRWTQWSKPYIPKNGNRNIQTSECVHCNKVRIIKMPL